MPVITVRTHPIVGAHPTGQEDRLIAPWREKRVHPSPRAPRDALTSAMEGLVGTMPAWVVALWETLYGRIVTAGVGPIKAIRAPSMLIVEPVILVSGIR